jgi:hypothetical protein
MRPSRLTPLPLLPLALLLALAGPAWAQDDPAARPGPGAVASGFDQLVYKGLVGNVLDAVPMDPLERLGLQRTNAVVSSTLFGRSLALLAGLSNPALLLGGLAWGLWSAANINPIEAGMKLAANRGRSGSGVAAQEPSGALPYRSSAMDDAPVNTATEPVLMVSNSAVNPALPLPSRPHVIRIWLPQRSSALPQ